MPSARAMGIGFTASCADHDHSVYFLHSAIISSAVITSVTVVAMGVLYQACCAVWVKMYVLRNTIRNQKLVNLYGRLYVLRFKYCPSPALPTNLSPSKTMLPREKTYAADPGIVMPSYGL